MKKIQNMIYKEDAKNQQAKKKPENEKGIPKIEKLRKRIIIWYKEDAKIMWTLIKSTYV